MRIGGISVSRVIVNGSSVDYAGCQNIDIGSGSGNCCDPGQDCPASECTQLSSECPNGLSTGFTFTAPDGTAVTLNWVCNPADGNYSRFLSTGGVWSFAHESAYGGWVLRNLITGHIWVWPDLNGPICALTGFAMFPQDTSDVEIDMVPTSSCATSSYDCTGGNCVGKSGAGGTYATIELCKTNCITTYNCVAGACVPVAGTGGTHKTLALCQDLCTGTDPSNICCPDGVNATLMMRFSLITGTCVGCVESLAPVTLSYGLFSPTAWSSLYRNWPCLSPLQTDKWSLDCDSGSWVLGFTGGATIVRVSAACSPFQVVFDVTNIGGGLTGLCGVGVGTLRVTITDS